MFNLHPSRQCAFHRAINEPCALHLSPPKGGSKREFFYIVCLSFHIFVAGNCRHFKFGMPIEHSKSQPKDDKLSLKWPCSGHVNHLKFGGHRSSQERLKLEWSDFVHMYRLYQVPAYGWQITLKRGVVRSREPFWILRSPLISFAVWNLCANPPQWFASTTVRWRSNKFTLCRQQHWW